jgi:DNA-binding CsgD family transcriptional regulator
MRYKVLQRLSEHPTAIWSVLGLGAFGIWMNLVGYSVAFAPPAIITELSWQLELNRRAFYFGLIGCGVLFLIFDKRLISIKHYLDFCLIILMSLGTAAFGIAYRQEVFNPTLLAIGGCFCSGIGYAWFVRSFYLQLALKESFRVSIIAVALSLIVETVLSMTFKLLLPHSAQIIVGICAPPLGCLILIILATKTRTLKVAISKFEHKQERFQIQLLFLVYFSMLVIRATTAAGLWGNARIDLRQLPFDESLIVIGACLLFSVIAWFALVRRSDAPLYIRYQAPMLTLATGCVIYLISSAVSIDSRSITSSIVVEAIELFAHLLLWTLVIASIRSLHFSPYQVLGWTAVLYGVISQIWISFFEKSGSSLPYIAALCVAYAVVLFLVFAPLKARESQTETINSICSVIADRYGLTRRESEILSLLAQGRSRPYMQKKLSLADGTVKTHVLHVYAKLEVHDRQQLLDFIEAFEGH